MLNYLTTKIFGTFFSSLDEGEKNEFGFKGRWWEKVKAF